MNQRTNGPTYQRTGHGTTTLAFEEPTVFAQSVKDRCGISLGSPDVPVCDIKKMYGGLSRTRPAELPELSEADVTRHFTRLSILNYSKDLGFYPLGSCTMKHNPKVANSAAILPGFADTHPYEPVEFIQGNLKLCHTLERWLAELSGMDAVSLWPAAGSHGELTGMLVIHAYHSSNGKVRSRVLIPDSAHGTNPASAAICGYGVMTIKSGADGLIDPNAVEAAMDEETAAIMITNPNTLGIFEENFKEVADIVHSKGGLVYLDGANLNALMGYVKPGEIGADVMHMNLHKTFGTPHGGGGPGAGPIGVVSRLEPFLPIPRIEECGGKFEVTCARPKSIGRINTFMGNFGVLVRAYAYLLVLGAEGLIDVTNMAVLNANYVRARLKDVYHLPYDKPVLHECVFSDRDQQTHGVKTLDIAKRLMDYGFHPPTIYFPRIVAGAIMIEPTETECKTILDEFCDAMITIAKECERNPELVKGAPHLPFRRRLDEVRAAREPLVTEQIR